MSKIYRQPRIEYMFEGYVTIIRYSFQDKLYYGKIENENIKSFALILFDGKTIQDAKENFQKAVKDYKEYVNNPQITSRVLVAILKDNNWVQFATTKIDKKTFSNSVLLLFLEQQKTKKHKIKPCCCFTFYQYCGIIFSANKKESKNMINTKRNTIAYLVSILFISIIFTSFFSSSGVAMLGSQKTEPITFVYVETAKK